MFIYHICSAVEGAEQGEIRQAGFNAKIKTFKEKLMFEYYLR